jgi:hypothetical protein
MALSAFSLPNTFSRSALCVAKDFPLSVMKSEFLKNLTSTWIVFSLSHLFLADKAFLASV